MTEQMPPFSYIENGNLTGFATEIAKAVVKEAQIDYTIDLFPWARAYQTAIRQKNILIFILVRNESRENLFTWLGPIAPRKIHAFKLKKRADLFMGNEFIMAHIIKKEGFDCRHIEKVMTIVEKDAYDLGVSRGTPEKLILDFPVGVRLLSKLNTNYQGCADL